MILHAATAIERMQVIFLSQGGKRSILILGGGAEVPGHRSSEIASSAKSSIFILKSPGGCEGGGGRHKILKGGTHPEKLNPGMTRMSAVIGNLHNSTHHQKHYIQ